jgi:hypothetical protein
MKFNFITNDKAIRKTNFKLERLHLGFNFTQDHSQLCRGNIKKLQSFGIEQYLQDETRENTFFGINMNFIIKMNSE